MVEELELEDEDRSYEIEQLLHWRWIGPSGRRRRREFLVLWKNYSINVASWILEDNFDFPEEIPIMMERDQSTNDTFEILTFRG